MRHKFEDWYWLNNHSKEFLQNGYLEGDEKEHFKKIAEKAEKILGEKGYAKRLLDNLKKGWYLLPTPGITNFLHDTEASISCFGSYCEDSVEGLLTTDAEVGMLSKIGGGTSSDLSDIRTKGAPISGGGFADGVMRMVKRGQDTTSWITQRSRRGKWAVYYDVDSPEIHDFLTIKDRTSDIHEVPFAVKVGDDFITKLKEGDKNSREIWAKIIKKKFETGFPYIMYKDNVNNNLNDIYKEKGLKVNNSNLCIVGSDRVLSNRGYLTAKELYEQGGELTLFNGKEAVQSSEMKLREKNVPVYKATLANGMSLTATDYHGMAVMDDSGSIMRTPLKDLRIGDKIAVQTNKGIFGDLSMEDEAFLLGLYQSDGTQNKEDIMLDVWENDFDLVDEIQEKFNSIHYKYKCDTYTCGNHGKERSKKPATFHECVVSNGNIRKKRLSSRTLKKSLNFEKGYVPSWIWESNERTQWEYLRGLLYADGTVYKSKSKGEPLQLSYADVNKSFLEDLQILFNNLGLSSSIHLLREGGEALLPDGKGSHKLYNTKVCYRLVIGNKNDALIVEENTGFLTRKGVILEDRVYRNNSKKRSKVISIEYVGEEDVYCPTVYTDEHVFVANGMLTFNCTEILLSNSHKETFVCCIAAMNCVHFEEWKDTDAVEVLLMLLDAFLRDFIDKNKDNPLMSRSVSFAENQMAVGIGLSGWHSYLQMNMIPIESMDAKFKNVEVFKRLKELSYHASTKLAEKWGRAPIFEGTNIERRHATLNAIAPNTSSSEIVGQWSQSIEPLYSNYYISAKSKNKRTVKNFWLEKLLEEKGENTKEVWDKIRLSNGSVQNLNILTEDEKKVFKTFQEISPMELLIQNSVRTKYIDQGISFNTMIPYGTPAKDVSNYYLKAHELGIKTMYYQLNQNSAQEFTRRSIMECDTCAG